METGGPLDRMLQPCCAGWKSFRDMKRAPHLGQEAHLHAVEPQEFPRSTALALCSPDGKGHTGWLFPSSESTLRAGYGYNYATPSQVPAIFCQAWRGCEPSPLTGRPCFDKVSDACDQPRRIE